MVNVINISTSGDFVMAERILERVKKQLPAMTIEAMRKWGKILERDMKVSLEQSGVRPFTTASFGPGIRWEQGKKSYIGSLIMYQYLLALDNMNPHWVTVKRSRSVLLRWAKQSENFRKKAKLVESGKLKRFGIYVKPHPFISNGWRRARPKLKPILNNMVKRTIKT